MYEWNGSSGTEVRLDEPHLKHFFWLFIYVISSSSNNIQVTYYIVL